MRHDIRHLGAGWRGAVLGALAAICLPSPVRADGPHKTASFVQKPAEWFAGDQARRVADNILTFQHDSGGWPKNTDTTSAAYKGDRGKLQPTFDNGATTDELRVLARVHAATKDARYQAAFAKGLDYILKAQYDHGGWPQSYPVPKGYGRHITFNDKAMVRLMEFVRELADNKGGVYGLLGDPQRQACRDAFDRGVKCILRCQVKVGGKLTAWCAQHDEKDFSPRPARTYELVSLSGFESVGILRLLMSLDNPSSEIVQAVEAGIAWFESAKLKGIRVEAREVSGAPGGKDRFVVQDPAAPPLWARFYEIGTNKPIFCDRDGVPKPALADIGHERRNGYAWLGGWAQPLLEKDYPAWKKRLARP